ncbi:MAG TPA: DNA mismatch repair endonuclease MutL, partial [Thermodesulfovibrionia bacterium]|nr:DNA mismatch repair endonuclease MutL [Thermodesulfovibrionia bacterium]
MLLDTVKLKPNMPTEHQQTIHILPDLLINKIAAGEVIERPASVVRELVDNALDAEARTIEVRLLYGGKKLISVTDDGLGMTRQDALLSIERHSTSKILTEDDLFCITTLGFRGEALSSIGAVSKLTMTTARQNSQVGVAIELANGQRQVRDAPAVAGTTVEVRDLFYNTPARRKFLKKTSTELAHILEGITQKALIYPEKTFILIHDDIELLRVHAVSTLEERLCQLYGEDFFASFLKIEPKQLKTLSLYGYVSLPEKARKTRANQHIVINRRPVRNTTVSSAVYTACRERLQPGTHPQYFLFLTMATESLDVNVHPAKMEVRFEDSEKVFQDVFVSIRKTLLPATAIDIQPKPLQSQETSAISSNNEALSINQQHGSAGRQQAGFLSYSDAKPSGLGTGRSGSGFYIGESFLAMHTEGGFTIVDSHAAHERVLYEKFLKKINIVSQGLLYPAVVELPVQEFHVVMDNIAAFQ